VDNPGDVCRCDGASSSNKLVRNKLKRGGAVMVCFCVNTVSFLASSPIIATTLLRGAEDDARGS